MQQLLQSAYSRTALYLFLTASSLPLIQSAPVPLHLPSWLQSLEPQKGATVQDEIKCYSLPYGGIGFLSHILTYWTIYWLGHGKRPYFPWKKLSTGKIDLCLAFVQIVITVGLASFTIVRCRSRWQFILLAVWKLIMSFTVGLWSVTASIKAIKYKDYKTVGTEPEKTKVWSSSGRATAMLAPYFISMVIGLVGLISLVAFNIHLPQVWKITAAFGAVVAFMGALGFLSMCAGEEGCCSSCLWGAGGIVGFIPGFMLFLGAFYTDWILGALANNLIGVPSGDNAVLYWIYFGAKRIPLFLT